MFINRNQKYLEIQTKIIGFILNAKITKTKNVQYI